MARYYFRTSRKDDVVISNPIEYDSPEDARRAAVIFAGEMLCLKPDMLNDDELQVAVTREDGLILFTFVAVGIRSPAAIIGSVGQPPATA